ncbi:MAG: HNH endonuclease [Verrucomicrobia bacterium]|nr:HNH endonuclease [Verrucomicrobiota bacterium]
MSKLPSGLVKLVRDRAEGRCEYCHFPESHTQVGFQTDHIIASKHAGTSNDSNLASACYYCNVHKGPNVAGVDPITGDIVRLYHPRSDTWLDHFRWDGPWLFGHTAIARATIHVLEINEASAVQLRALLLEEGISLD